MCARRQNANSRERERKRVAPREKESGFLNIYIQGGAPPLHPRKSLAI
jgi:hypothetical protein